MTLPKYLLSFAAVAALSTAASAMPVSTFLAKMDQLAKEGPMATATSDAALVKKRTS